MLGVTQLERSFAEKDLRVLVDTKLNMCLQCVLAAKKDSSILVYVQRNVASSLRQNPIVNFEQPLHLEKWFPRQLIRSKREEIRDLILQLHFQQHSGSSS
ncbi:hypothetical protein QYF61_000723 [Mycteria americana]|uniref:Uncharacterized protein n=1 Tax=Mycteria americana TaxID=33587 RepID=A0AAN7NNM7_MYCAM|nr:hypothetical protein QYF61_000723 [Mycteria americana]